MLDAEPVSIKLESNRQPAAVLELGVQLKVPLRFEPPELYCQVPVTLLPASVPVSEMPPALLPPTIELPVRTRVSSTAGLVPDPQRPVQLQEAGRSEEVGDAEVVVVATASSVRPARVMTTARGT